MATVLIDVDGVVADFTSRFVEIAEDILGRPLDKTRVYDQFIVEKSLGLTPVESKLVYKRVAAPDFAWSLYPLPQAVEAIKEIALSNVVIFVTKPFRSSKTWQWEREKWLRQYFGDVGANVIHTKLKYLVHGDVLIEDSGKNAADWWHYQRRIVGNPTAKVLLRDYPYNSEFNFTRFNDWSVVKALISRDD
jgi:5'(3')-deoxyribonucleotidase